MADKKPSYWELLRHPHWQKKRLEILDRAQFACEKCDDTEKTLNVHHSYYEKGLKPWEYPSESLRCLCEDCHREEQSKLTNLHRQIGKLSMPDLERLHGYALGLETTDLPMVPIDVYSHECARGVADVWGLSVDIVVNALQEGQIDGYTLYALGHNGERLDQA